MNFDLIQDIQDILIIVDIILGFDGASTLQADVNTDGIINEGDVEYLVQLIINI